MIIMVSFSVSAKSFCRILSLASVCLFFFGNVSYAQSDKDRPLIEAPIAEENPYHVKEDISKTPTQKNRSAIKGADNKEDQSGYGTKPVKEEKDGKQEAQSTLSFNLFLYVIDKFKEK